MENNINEKLNERLALVLEGLKDGGRSCCLAFIEIVKPVESNPNQASYLEVHEIYKAIRSDLDEKSSCFFSFDKLKHAIIFPQSTLISASKEIELIVTKLETINIRLGREEKISFYVGLAHCSAGMGLSSEELVERTQEALDKCKEGPSGEILYYDDLNYYV